MVPEDAWPSDAVSQMYHSLHQISWEREHLKHRIHILVYYGYEQFWLLLVSKYSKIGIIAPAVSKCAYLNENKLLLICMMK